ncbi:hypothetical protein D3C87_1427330 [compost metagenome]
MLENFVAVSGTRVAFLSDLIRGSGLRIKNPVDRLYSQHGFLFPTEVNSFNVVAYLNGDKSMEVANEGVIKGLMLRHDGQLDEWVRGDNNAASLPRMIKRVMPWGEGVVFARSNSMTLEESLTAALDVHDDNLELAVALTKETLRHGPSQIHIMNIPDILVELNKRFPLKGKGK